MLFFYLRHGNPVYDPDALTPLGEKQAEALAKRLALYGIDEIYASTSRRALQTAWPTADLLNKPITELDFANEGHAWREFTYVNDENQRMWLFQSQKAREIFADGRVISLGFDWYRDGAFSDYAYQKGLDRVYDASDAFFLAQGYRHIRQTGRYEVVAPNAKRVALFAHQGFGIAFLSCLLDIPYPLFANHFDMCHTGMTVIEFKERNGIAIPKVLTLSSDAHLYREGIATDYNHQVRF